jgi:multisubunit Na+/H+ antiporter MnhG subunit
VLTANRDVLLLLLLKLLLVVGASLGAVRTKDSAERRHVQTQSNENENEIDLIPNILATVW